MNDNNGQEIENKIETKKTYVLAGLIIILCIVLAGVV
tara:strand:+ start:140 stop:250 length:111 start_codon:yes stop_codon:yes gene_type:complete